MKVKNTFFKNVLTLEECKFFENRILEYKRSGLLYMTECPPDQNIDQISRPFYQINFGEENRLNLIQRLSSLIKTEYPENLKFSHSFLTIYRNGSTLEVHNDKPNYDITLSVNIGGLENWAIKVSKIPIDEGIDYNDLEKDNYPSVDIITHKKKENHDVIFTPKGSGAAFYSRRTLHWRDILNCSDDEYVMQVFFHWTFIR